jgi:membrane dipeptidase
MNYLGMMVDISHVADTTFWDALEVSQAPMIASHSSCRDIADHRRNMTDEMIEALAAKGGVIHINFATGFINPGNSAGATARHVVDHFDHAIRLVGAAHVGIGADWDGTSIPADVGDVTWLPTLTLELLKRGHGEEDIKMALGGSTLRVMAEVEAVAARLQAEERARNRGN